MPRLGVDAPLVGRADEFGRLTAALDAARDGHPAAVLLAGDAGVGKTRLLSELADHARAGGFEVLVGHCVDIAAAGLPYLPFSEALRRLDPGRLRPALAPLLPAPATATDNPGPAGDFGQLQLFDAVSGLLAELTLDAPLLLVIEDLHWADQSTRDLLSFLLTRMRSERLAVVASYRADDLHRRHPLRPLLGELVRLPVVQRVEVAPFTPAESRDYLKALHPEPISVRAARRIVERSEGNAFFLEELLEASLAANTDPDALPTGLAEVLLTRLEQVTAGAQTVVRAAAVAGRRVDHRLLQQVVRLSDDETEEALREAITRHVLVPEDGGTYAFRHALLQEAVYGDLLPSERVRLHGAYAVGLGASGSSALGGNSPAAELAYHCLASHDLPGALVASVQAATDASRLHAPVETLKHLEQALTLWHAVPDADALTGLDMVTLGLRAAAAANASGRLERAVALAQATYDLIDPPQDPLLAGKVLHRLAYHLLSVDRHEEALAAATEARKLVPAEPPTPERTWIVAVSARTALMVSDYEAVRRFADEAVAAAGPLGLADAEADALASLAVLAEKQGDPEQAAAQLTEARDRAAATGDVAVEMRAGYNLAANRFYGGDLAAATTLLEHIAARAAANGMTWSEWGTELQVLRVVLRYLTGDWDGSLAAADLTPDAPDVAAARVNAAALHVEVARGLPTADRRLGRARKTAHLEPQVAAFTGGCGADLLQWRGDFAGARAAIDQAIERVGKVWGRWQLGGIWLAALGLSAEADRAAAARIMADRAGAAAAVAAGEALIAHARDTARFGLPRAAVLGPEGRAWLARAEAEWSRLNGSVDPAPWEAAVAAFDFGYRYEVARCRWRLAETLLGADRRDEAAEAARAAHATAVQLGAAPLQAAVEALVRRGRLDAGLPVDVTAELLFTPRERDVLALLAHGRTNRQIGRELFISEKTASVHVSNIIGKLHASGRTEAVALAHQRGLIGTRPAEV